MSLATGVATYSPETRPASTRSAIVAALGGVVGLTAYPVAPDAATAGAAWPRWVRTDYDGPLSTLATDTYDVLVTLPADYNAHTVDQGDALRDVVALELVKLGRVAAEPRRISFNDQQTMPGLWFRLVTT
jgi:hypothetical protein